MRMGSKEFYAKRKPNERTPKEQQLRDVRAAATMLASALTPGPNGSDEGRLTSFEPDNVREYFEQFREQALEMTKELDLIKVLGLGSVPSAETFDGMRPYFFAMTDALFALEQKP